MPEQPNQQPEPVPEAERADLFNRFRSLDVMINNDISEVSRGPSSQGPFWSYGGRSFETEEAARSDSRAPSNGSASSARSGRCSGRLGSATEIGTDQRDIPHDHSPNDILTRGPLASE